MDNRVTDQFPRYYRPGSFDTSKAGILGLDEHHHRLLRRRDEYYICIGS